MTKCPTCKYAMWQTVKNKIVNSGCILLNLPDLMNSENGRLPETEA